MTDTAKYLGITISQDMKWTKHITQTCSRANRALGFIKRNVKVRSPRIKGALYRMRRYNITADIIRVVQSLYDKSTIKCSTHKRYTGGLVPHHHRRQAGMYLVAYPVQHIYRGHYDRGPRKTPWRSQHRRKNHRQLAVRRRH